MSQSLISTSASHRWVADLWLAAGCERREATLTADHLVGAVHMRGDPERRTRHERAEAVPIDGGALAQMDAAAAAPSELVIPTPIDRLDLLQLRRLSHRRLIHPVSK